MTPFEVAVIGMLIVATFVGFAAFMTWLALR